MIGSRHLKGAVTTHRNGKMGVVKVATYNVRVGRPFNNGIGCQAIENAVDGALGCGMCSGVKCQDDGVGGTRLQFTAGPNEARKINGALGRMYPMIGGFDCPNH